MPSFNVITVQDRESTPVDHAFKPLNIDGNTAIFENSNGTPAGSERLTVTTVRRNDRTKVTLVLNDPVVVDETINGVVRSKVERRAYARLELTFDGHSTPQERDNLVGLVSGLVDSSNTDMSSVLVDLESFYS